MIVMKFGGTSNEDAAAMRNVTRLVKEHLQEQPVVVISAIARATNELEQIARTAALGDQAQASQLIASLFRRHDAIIADFLTSKEGAEQLKAVFTLYQLELTQLVRGIAILKELTPRTMDIICSYGERLSSHIIACGLEEAGVDAVWVDAKDFMITDDNYGRAQPLMDKVTERLASVMGPLLSLGKTPVTQGFIGVTQSGVYTTMGRESSDYSASIIGAAMSADRVQIWTDVDGILTADPRVVGATKKVRRMSFEEAFELSYFGAKVLHPNTMLPLLEKKIPVQILNSKRDDSTGTLVEVDSTTSRFTIKSIAHKKNLSVIAMSPHRRYGQYLFWEGIFSVLSKYGISSPLAATSEYSISFLVDDRFLADGLIHDLGEFGMVQVAGGKGSICVVGKGLRANSGVVTTIVDALGEVNVAMISFGASDSNITMVLDADQIVGALKRLHAKFFEGVKETEIFEPISAS